MERGGVHLHAVCQPDSSTQGRCGKRQTCIPARHRPIMKEERLYVLEP
ncbi:hypothetical protein HMPREF1608_02220 [Escherichia coli 908525]|nr:hypothetical protein HMPREF1608_02220 [Escherichia coli 908525]